MNARGQQKTLILLTDFFPFEAFEPYLENEFQYLQQSFDKIFIFSVSGKKEPIYELAANVSAFNNPVTSGGFSKINSLFSFDRKLYGAEKKFVQLVLHQQMDITRTKIMVMEYFKARMLVKYIKSTLSAEFDHPENLCIYSYWSDYKAIAAAILKKEFPKLKAISRAHGWDVYFERNAAAYLPLRTFIFDVLDKVFFVSENGKNYSSAKYRDISKFAVARLGTHKPAVPVLERKRKPFHIVSCSSLIPLKRVSLLIEAIALIPDKRELLWTHFGDGFLKDELEKLAHEKLSDKRNTHYSFKGHVPNSEVLQFYTKNDVNLLVNTSSTEGLPMTMMEAMSCAIPVTGTNVGGVSEIIADNHNGFLLSANPEPAEIASKILCFMDMNDAGYVQFMKNAFDTWNTKYNAAVNFAEFLKIVKNDI